MSCLAQARSCSSVHVYVADQQLLLELLGARDRLARVVDDERLPVEDQLVLAADERAEGDACEVVARALGKHRLALCTLACVVRRGRDVEDQRRASKCLVARRRAWLPDVLADRQAKAL